LVSHRSSVIFPVYSYNSKIFEERFRDTHNGFPPVDHNLLNDERTEHVQILNEWNGSSADRTIPQRRYPQIEFDYITGLQRPGCFEDGEMPWDAEMSGECRSEIAGKLKGVVIKKSKSMHDAIETFNPSGGCAKYMVFQV
jgi:hypothetical protein